MADFALYHQTIILPARSGKPRDKALVKGVVNILYLRVYARLDPNKHINGCKRTLVVDTQGRLWVADVDAANRADDSLGKGLIVTMLLRVGERLEKYSAIKPTTGYLLPPWRTGELILRKPPSPNQPPGSSPLPSGGSSSGVSRIDARVGL